MICLFQQTPTGLLHCPVWSPEVKTLADMSSLSYVLFSGSTAYENSPSRLFLSVIGVLIGDGPGGL